MPNNAKKKVNKIKGVEKAHPHSRKAVQLRRAFAREDRVKKLKSVKHSEHASAVNRMVWFKYALGDEVDVATRQDMHELVMQFIMRHDEEISILKAGRRPNQAPPARLITLESLRSQELSEYESGFKIANMTDAANVKMLQKWDGDFNGLPSIKTMYLAREKVLEAKPAEAIPLAAASKTTIAGLTGMDTDDV
ncbi:hypothetical protein HK101_000610 [Irineochytrium annulatum]|nr:hypothetical protein HK101_000610 [Irineochytrium annulatum]